MKKDCGIRKNLQALSPNQRKQYFWCLKMLGILPAMKGSLDRYYLSYGLPNSSTTKNPPTPFNKIEPMCLHDQLIASHSTCCQHGSFFFAYYHRHLMVQFQMMINYVHQVLWKCQEDFQKLFPDLYSLQATRWGRVLQEYKKLAPPNKKVMAHYWNPTNYNNRNDLVIPQELADPVLYKEHNSFDDVDLIYNSVRGHYPYEINVKTRWYNKQGQKHFDETKTDFQQEMLANQYFYKDYPQTEGDKALISGDLGPRSHNFQFFYKHFTVFQNFSINGVDNYPNSFKISSTYNYNKFNQGDNKMTVYPQSEGEILVNFGGKLRRGAVEYSNEYLNQKELKPQRTFNTLNKINYNSSLPHYQLGYALFNKQYNKYVDYLTPDGTSLENSHNTMHNNMHFTMIDGLYSLTNPLFFIYHSWIDVQVEMKLRMCDNQEQAYFIYKKLNTITPRQQYVDPLLNPNKQLKVFGQYPIIQWIDPLFTNKVTNPNSSFDQKVQMCKELKLSQNSVKSAFSSSSYILKNNSKIRNSLELSQFYKQSFIPQNGDRFKEFQGFKDYDANFDIQIFQTAYDQSSKTTIDSKYPLGTYQEGNVKIPAYLTQMKGIVNHYYHKLVEYIEKYRKCIQKPKQIDYYTQLVEKGLLLRIKYRSTVPNGIYNIDADLQKFALYLEQKGYKLTEQEKWFCAQNNGQHTIYNLTVFGAASNAANCPNCGVFKSVFINMNEELYLRSLKLWSYINLIILKEIVYSTEWQNQPEKQIIEPTLDNVLSIEGTDKNDNFKFIPISGAEQVSFDIYFTTDIQKLQHFNCQISLDITETQEFKSNSVTTRNIEGYQLTQITPTLLDDKRVYNVKSNFYNLKLNRPIGRLSLDGLLYTKVTFSVFANNRFARFSFPIKNYHDHIKYQVSIINLKEINNALNVVVKDADYAFKKDLFTQVK